MIGLWALVAVAASVASASSVSASWRDVKRVHVVDYSNKTGNFLFRGASPNVASGSQFDIAKLRAALAQAASDDGYSLPSSYQIVDVNLLNMDEGSYDEGETISEFSYFDANPQDGQFLFWQTLGTESNATDPSIPPSMLAYLAQSFPQWDNDNLFQRVNALNALLNTQHATPLAIYFHCDEGCDRTGETAGAYAMTFQGLTWQATNARNTLKCGRPQMCRWYKMMQWYCLWHFKNSPTCLKNIDCTPTQK